MTLTKDIVYGTISATLMPRPGIQGEEVITVYPDDIAAIRANLPSGNTVLYVRHINQPFYLTDLFVDFQRFWWEARGELT